MAEDSLRDGGVCSSATAALEWLVCFAAAGTLRDNMAASFGGNFFLWVFVFRSSRRRPHLHDGFNYSPICLACSHIEIVGNEKCGFITVRKLPSRNEQFLRIPVRLPPVLSIDARGGQQASVCSPSSCAGRDGSSGVDE